MKGMLKALTAVAMAAAFTATTAQAQARFGVAGTGAFSLESGGGSSMGAMALADIAMNNSPIGIRLDGAYYFDDGGAVQFNADAVYTFQTSETSVVHPYILAGGTWMAPDDFKNGRFGVAGGAGFNFMLQSNRNITPFAEARFDYLFKKTISGVELDAAKNLQVAVGVKIGG
jgi:hypothetical protein